MSKATDILDRYKSAAKARDEMRPLWQDLADHFLPGQARFTASVSAGDDDPSEQYDSSPQLARRGLSTAIDGLLKPSTKRWFWLKAKEEELNEVEAVRLWLEVVQDRMWTAIYAPRARFIQRSGEVDNALATFGLGYLFIDERMDFSGLRFSAPFIGDSCFEENADGRVDTFYLCRRYTARQAEQRYGEGMLGKRIKEALRDPKQADKKFEFVQGVYPNRNYNPRSRLSTRLLFAGCEVAVADETIVRESGFHEFPVAVPRWETTPGQLYPRSPAQIALADARTLQAMGHTLLVGGQRAVDPPTWMVDDAALSPVRTFPGGFTIVDAEAVRSTNGHPIGQLEMGSSVPIGREMQEDMRRQLEAAFFKNVFNLPISDKEMTATEILERKQEYLRIIGPVMGQLESDYIGVVVDRVFGLMMRAGALPEPPEELMGQELEFEFMSPIQQARREIEGVSLANSLSLVAPIAEFQPQILDNFDGDEFVRDMPAMFSWPSRWLKTRQAVQEKRQQDAQMQQAAMALQGGEQLAKIGKMSREGQAA